MKGTKLLLLAAVGIAVFWAAISAADSKEEKEEVRLGNIGGSVNVTGASTSPGSSQIGYVGSRDYGSKSNPVSGSVFRVSGREWKARVFNNSEDTYNATVEVVQFDKNGSRVTSSRYSFRLKGGEERERIIRARTNTTSCTLNLVKAVNLTPKKKEEDKEANGLVKK